MRSDAEGNALASTAVVSRHDDSGRLPRRHFLLALGLAGTGVTAAIAARAFMAPGRASRGVAAAPPSGSGYVINDHIRRYYQTAKV